jgi:hypothetical protein
MYAELLFINQIMVLINTVVVLVMNGLYVTSVTQQRQRWVLSGIVLLVSFVQDWMERSNQSYRVVGNVEYISVRGT